MEVLKNSEFLKQCKEVKPFSLKLECRRECCKNKYVLKAKSNSYLENGKPFDFKTYFESDVIAFNFYGYAIEITEIEDH